MLQLLSLKAKLILGGVLFVILVGLFIYLRGYWIEVGFGRGVKAANESWNDRYMALLASKTKDDTTTTRIEIPQPLIQGKKKDTTTAKRSNEADSIVLAENFGQMQLEYIRITTFAHLVVDTTRITSEDTSRTVVDVWYDPYQREFDWTIKLPPIKVDVMKIRRQNIVYIRPGWKERSIDGLIGGTAVGAILFASGDDRAKYVAIGGVGILAILWLTDYGAQTDVVESEK